MIIGGKLDDENGNDDEAANHDDDADDDDDNLHDKKDRYSTASDYWREKAGAPP